MMKRVSFGAFRMSPISSLQDTSTSRTSFLCVGGGDGGRAERGGVRGREELGEDGGRAELGGGGGRAERGGGGGGGGAERGGGGAKAGRGVDEDMAGLASGSVPVMETERFAVPPPKSVIRSRIHFFAVLSRLLSVLKTIKHYRQYDSIATVGESRVWWRADFQSGSSVLKKVF